MKLAEMRALISAIKERKTVPYLSGTVFLIEDIILDFVIKKKIYLFFFL